MSLIKYHEGGSYFFINGEMNNNQEVKNYLFEIKTFYVFFHIYQILRSGPASGSTPVLKKTPVQLEKIQNAFKNDFFDGIFNSPKMSGRERSRQWILDNLALVRFTKSHLVVPVE